MDSKDIKTITLRVNSEDAAKKLDALQKKLEKANKARDESKRLEADLNKTLDADVLLHHKLNQELSSGLLSLQEEKKHKAQIQELDKKMSEAERAKVKAQKEITKQIKEAAKVEKNIDKMRGQYAALERTMANLGKATVPELKNAIKILERTMNSGAVERGTKEWETFEQQIRECRIELKKLDDATNTPKEKKDSIDKFADFGTKWVGIIGTVNMGTELIDKTTQWVRGLVQEYAEMNEHLADVHKYTGLSKESIKGLNEEFKNMDTRTSREALNDLAADAGRLGIQSKEKVMEFVQAADMINVALGEDLGEDAVKNIGKLTQLFKVDQTMGLRDGMLATASVINELAQTSSASEPYILEFTSRLAGVGYQAGIEQPKIMALASVLDQGMVGVEKGATALQNILTALMRKPAELAKIAGLQVSEFTKLLKTDANAALIQFIESVSKAGRLDAIAPMLDDMKLSGSGATQVMATLANNIDLVKSTQEQATKAFIDGTSVVEEFNKANSTELAAIEKAQKKYREARIELGEAFAPISANLISTSSLTIKAVTAVVKVLREYTGTVVTLGVAWAIYTAIIYKALIAQKAKIAVDTIDNAISKIGTVLTNLKTIAVKALAVAYYRMQGRTYAAERAQNALNAAMTASVFGAVLTIVSLLIMAYQYLYGESENLITAQEQLNKIKQDAAHSLDEERLKIELLRKTAADEVLEMDKRLNAVKKLNEIIPDYNAQIDKTTGKYKESTQALQDYLNTLQEKYEIEGAESNLKRLGEERAGLIVQIEKEKAELKKSREDKEKALKTSSPMPGGNGIAVLLGLAAIEKDKHDLNNLNDALAENERTVAAIKKVYGGRLADKFANENSVTTSDDNGGGNGYTSAPSKSEQNEAERRHIAQAQAEIEQAAAASRQAAISDYQMGVQTLREHREEVLRIERETLVKKRDLYKKGSVDWIKANAELGKIAQEQDKKRNEWSIEQLDIEQKAELRALDERAATTLMKEEDLQEERNRIAIKYLEKRRDLYRDFGQVEDHAKAEIALKEEENRQKLEKERQFADKVKKLRDEYAKKSASEVMKIELDTLNAAREKNLVDEETYQKMLRQIRLKYQGADGNGGQIAEEKKKKTDKIFEDATPEEAKALQTAEPSSNTADFGVSGLMFYAAKNKIAQQTYDNLKKMREEDLISQEDYNLAVQELDKQRFAQGAQAAYATVGAIMQSLSAVQQASSRAEEAKLTAKYDAEIKAAEGNSEKVKKLEAEKAAALAEIKTKANKRAMAIEIAQATAAAAMAAMNAYKATVGIPVVGPVMAPIAAAAAAAFGAAQIATIVKQHEAQEAGYYEGGFTGGKQYRRRAGVVHEGEFVANHLAVQNPNVLPVLQLLDHAQRTNTIASLTAADVSRAIAPTAQISAVSGATAATAPTVQVVPTEAPATLAAIRQLAEILAGGIEATVAIDGQNGVAHQLKKYQELKNRK